MLGNQQKPGKELVAPALVLVLAARDSLNRHVGNIGAALSERSLWFQESQRRGHGVVRGPGSPLASAESTKRVEQLHLPHLVVLKIPVANRAFSSPAQGAGGYAAGGWGASPVPSIPAPVCG